MPWHRFKVESSLQGLSKRLALFSIQLCCSSCQPLLYIHLKPTAEGVVQELPHKIAFLSPPPLAKSCVANCGERCKEAGKGSRDWKTVFGCNFCLCFLPSGAGSQDRLWTQGRPGGEQVLVRCYVAHGILVIYGHCSLPSHLHVQAGPRGGWQAFAPKPRLIMEDLAKGGGRARKADKTGTVAQNHWSAGGVAPSAWRFRV